MEHPAQGKRSDTLGLPHSRVYAPCKGKSLNPLCCYSYLIADLAVLKWNIVRIFVQHLRHVLKLLPLQGATAPTRDTQGAASLALGYGLPWAFSPSLLNPKLELYIYYSDLTNGVASDWLIKPKPVYEANLPITTLTPIAACGQLPASRPAGRCRRTPPHSCSACSTVCCSSVPTHRATCRCSAWCLWRWLPM